MSKLQIKQVSGKPAVNYSDIEPGVVFTYNEGSPYGNPAFMKILDGRVNLTTFGLFRNPVDAECTVYTSTLTMEV